MCTPQLTRAQGEGEMQGQKNRDRTDDVGTGCEWCTGPSGAHAHVSGGSENDATTVPTACTGQLDGVVRCHGTEAAAYL